MIPNPDKGSGNQVAGGASTKESHKETPVIGCHVAFDASAPCVCVCVDTCRKSEMVAVIELVGE